jgi:hypothetical protein
MSNTLTSNTLTSNTLTSNTLRIKFNSSPDRILNNVERVAYLDGELYVTSSGGVRVIGGIHSFVWMDASWTA